MKRILVVDDEDQVRAMLRETFERSGYEAVEATNGREALELYSENPADLVIIDIIMPQKEGIETITDLRKVYPDAKIFAISGGGRIGPEDYLSLASKCGAMRTFKKPLDRKEILLAVEQVLGKGL